MKTAISIPDKVFEAAERAAAKLGMSRSELYVNAVREYVDRYGREDVTEKLNAVYGAPDIESKLDPALAQMQSKILPRDSW
jgi:metal-responsive CopG/Arc/MetJ family transcriptional regulator